jgi:hypothetical protein
VTAQRQRDRPGHARPDRERKAPPGQRERQALASGSYRDGRRQGQPHHREPPGGHAVQQREHGRARPVGRGQHVGGLRAQVSRRRDRLPQRPEHDPHRRDHGGGAGLVRHQPRPDLGDDDDRGEQADAEHRVTGQQQRQPPLPRGDVRDQQRAVGGRDHRRHHRHQPATERVAVLDLVPRHHQVRDPDRGDQAERRPGQPQPPVDADRGGPDHVPAQHQRATAHRHQGHGGCPPELRHHRVRGMRPGPFGKFLPVHGPGGRQSDQHDRGQRPHHGREPAQPRHLERQDGGGVGHDAGAHHGGKPVRAEVAENVSRPFQIFQYAERCPVPARPHGACPGDVQRLCHAPSLAPGCGRQ